MIEILIEPGPWSAGDACRCRAIIRAGRPTPALGVIATLTAFEVLPRRSNPFAPSRRALLTKTVELAPAAFYEACQLPFEIRIPDLSELRRGPSSEFVRRLVGPVHDSPAIRFEVEVRMERRWRRDWTASSEIEIESSGRQRHAS